MAPIVTASITTVLFLGGTNGFEPIPGQVWFVGKVFLVISILLWIRSTWPRLRVSQIMGFAWKALFPLALINMFVVSVEVVVLQGINDGEISVGEMWIVAAINWVLTVASIVGISDLLGQRRIRRVQPIPSNLANMYAETD